MSVEMRDFGVLPGGEQITLYHLENKSGAFAEVINYGAILVKVCVPDREGNLRDVTLGYDDLAGYQSNPCFFGATIGRNGNRIGNASFEINGRRVNLAPNDNGRNNLHSGPDGFEKKVWDAVVTAGDKDEVIFERISPDMENGFPGEMTVSVTYTWTEDNMLQITYQAKADQDTVANFTNHSYFNLNGEGSGTIHDHRLQLLADYYTPVKDSEAIPTGEAASVKGTPMDFLAPKPIGQDIQADFEQLKFTGGYDHNFVTNDYVPGKVRVIARACSEASGIVMTVSSDLPCVQFYAGNFLKDESGKAGHVYHDRDGFALETQMEPDAVNVPAFHSPILKAGELYASVTAYQFSLL